MSIDDEFQREEVRGQVSILVMEHEELFEHIRGFTKSDTCAWLVVQAFFDWKRMEKLQAQRKIKGDRPVSEAQLKQLSTFGVENLADLSSIQAQTVIETLEKAFFAQNQEQDGYY